MSVRSHPSPDDAAEPLASTDQDESSLHQLARVSFDTLGLQNYLTAGPKESCLDDSVGRGMLKRVALSPTIHRRI